MEAIVLGVLSLIGLLGGSYFAYRSKRIESQDDRRAEVDKAKSDGQESADRRLAATLAQTDAAQIRERDARDQTEQRLGRELSVFSARTLELEGQVIAMTAHLSDARTALALSSQRTVQLTVEMTKAGIIVPPPVLL